MCRRAWTAEIVAHRTRRQDIVLQVRDRAAQGVCRAGAGVQTAGGGAAIGRYCFRGRGATNALRVNHRALVHCAIEERIRQKPRAEWMERFITAGIPAGCINRLDEVFADAQVRHCEMVRVVQHPELGPIPQLALPLRFDSLDVQDRKNVV